MNMLSIGLSRWCSGKESACQCRRHGFHPWVGKIPWRRKWQPAPVFLPGESHGQRSLAGYSPGGHQESNTTEQPSMHIAFNSQMWINEIGITRSYRTLSLTFLGTVQLLFKVAVSAAVSEISDFSTSFFNICC